MREDADGLLCVYLVQINIVHEALVAHLVFHLLAERLVEDQDRPIDSCTCRLGQDEVEMSRHTSLRGKLDPLGEAEQRKVVPWEGVVRPVFIYRRVPFEDTWLEASLQEVS